jgi:uncharacterized protein
MVVVQPTPFCNINCTYCYLPSRNDKAVIEQQTIANLFSKVFASGWSCPELTVVWHAGEPLVLPVAFYRQAFEAIERMRPESLRLKHSFQTNGMLITPEWCAFFDEWKPGVGVSIDGPRALHDRCRLTRAGGGTFDKTIAGIRLLRQHAIPFHVISVLSRESLGMAEELFDFYTAEGIEQVCFNVEESEGDYVSDLFTESDPQQRFMEFLRTFWQLSRASGQIKFLREVDTMVQRIFRPNEARMRNPQVEPLAMLNVDCHGNVSSFSPELLGYKNADYDDFLLGNINRDSLAQIHDTCLQSPLLRDIRTGVDACRNGCDYFSVCGGGAPVNKLSENGSFGSTRTWYCRLTQIAITDLILDAFTNLEQNWQDEASQAPRQNAAALGVASAKG